MKKVSVMALNSANVRVDNHEDTEKSYDLSANVSIAHNTVNGFESGEVMGQEGDTIATFNSWGEQNLSVSYNTMDADRQQEVLAAISGFMAEVKKVVKAGEASPLSF